MCECESCKLYLRVCSVREYLRSQGQDELLETLEELYSAYVHDGIDHEWLSAVVDNKWPSAEGHMKSKGWVRG